MHIFFILILLQDGKSNTTYQNAELCNYVYTVNTRLSVANREIRLRVQWKDHRCVCGMGFNTFTYVVACSSRDMCGWSMHCACVV